LAQNKILITQTSLIGSMLSNLLLVLGMCFFAGGFNRKQQFFNVTVVRTNCITELLKTPLLMTSRLKLLRVYLLWLWEV